MQNSARAGETRPRHVPSPLFALVGQAVSPASAACGRVLQVPLEAASADPPETLISQVCNTCPFRDARLFTAEPGRLVELGHSPDGFPRILAIWENLLRSGLSPGEELQDVDISSAKASYVPYLIQ